ncbi:type I-E CRISPR-associated protein Cse1/CasA [Lactococcus piscium]|uniref:type I-E CRISPR-associated protein Cse1/CasA n=1 Tax=Pseudolactococcus carnosus TaxID=2749961 RepID=UPI001FBA7D15|nr:type I-E CRISPR-associated protein Cse1/CasA [Lactococcus carnosus]MCJ1995820.1 type I-E CRISPR-associated protein Cse1/CasA [Lactococcus carnosus]
MAEFNLLDEPWLVVMTDDKGTIKEVSLKELFEHAHEYKCLAGETPTQDFAILRLLLAVLHTVFSRFDADGNQYDYVDLDEKYKQIQPINQDDDGRAYKKALLKTWQQLWQRKEFPDIIGDYLDKWHDRFYLFGGVFPFYQVSKETLGLPSNQINKAKPNQVSGKTINRVLSESENKVILFSPQHNAIKNKLKQSEIARWFVLYQGVTGTGDKVKFANQDEEQKLNKGWLYDLGGVYPSGDNLFATILLNLALVHPEPEFIQMQTPIWEEENNKIQLDKFRKLNQVNNLAFLYTNWSRAITMPDEYNENDEFSISVIKLPEILHQNNFLELMTEWRFNKVGDNKDTFTPKKHSLTEQFWRSFGATFIPSQTTQHRPGIVDWIIFLEDANICLGNVQFNAISMEDDGNATSWNPVNEIVDHLNFENILSDQDDSWNASISDQVDMIKIVIDRVLWSFANDIKTIRNLSSSEFVNRVKQTAYYQIDLPFRDWLANIQSSDEKEVKQKEWRRKLRKIIESEAQNLVESMGNRDILGVEDSTYIKNIFTAYNRFKYKLEEMLPKEKEE